MNSCYAPVTKHFVSSELERKKMQITFGTVKVWKKVWRELKLLDLYPPSFKFSNNILFSISLPAPHSPSTFPPATSLYDTKKITRYKKISSYFILPKIPENPKERQFLTQNFGNTQLPLCTTCERLSQSNIIK